MNFYWLYFNLRNLLSHKFQKNNENFNANSNVVMDIYRKCILCEALEIDVDFFLCYLYHIGFGRY